MSEPHVGTWLDDHLAVAVGALEVARRCRRENTQAPWAAPLDQLVSELESQRSNLEKLMDELGRRPSRLKQAAGWLAEKLGRLKLNDSLLKYSPLSRLEELETLLLAVASLGVMWRSIERVRQATSGGLDPARCAERMEHHLGVLRTLVGQAADEALALA